MLRGTDKLTKSVLSRVLMNLGDVKANGGGEGGGAPLFKVKAASLFEDRSKSWFPSIPLLLSPGIPS